MRIKIWQINLDIFPNQILLESIFAGVNRLFILIYTNQDDNSKRFKGKIYYLLKGIIKNYDVIINGKTFEIKPLIQI